AARRPSKCTASSTRCWRDRVDFHRGGTRGLFNAARMKSVFAVLALALFSMGAAAQVTLAYVGEISGSIAVSGGNFRDGVILAIEEINAKGGILKQKIDLTLYDTQTNPGVARAQMQKAIDGDPYVVMGPIFSGNVKVTMQM